MGLTPPASPSSTSTPSPFPPTACSVVTTTARGRPRRLLLPLLCTPAILSLLATPTPVSATLATLTPSPMSCPPHMRSPTRLSPPLLRPMLLRPTLLSQSPLEATRPSGDNGDLKGAVHEVPAIFGAPALNTQVNDASQGSLTVGTSAVITHSLGEPIVNEHTVTVPTYGHYGYGHYYGKREAEADPYLLYGAYGHGYGYGHGYYGHGGYYGYGLHGYGYAGHYYG